MARGERSFRGASTRPGAPSPRPLQREMLGSSAQNPDSIVGCEPDKWARDAHGRIRRGTDWKLRLAATDGNLRKLSRDDPARQDSTSTLSIANQAQAGCCIEDLDRAHARPWRGIDGFAREEVVEVAGQRSGRWRAPRDEERSEERRVGKECRSR